MDAAAACGGASGRDPLGAALLALDDADADFEFFTGLFDGGDDGGGVDTTDSESSENAPTSQHMTSARSDRRRQRWLAPSPLEGRKDLSVVIRLPPPPTVRQSEPGATASETLARAWEEIAKGQRQERKAAERENAELRELLRTQTLAIQKMFKLTQKVGDLARSLPRDETEYLGPAMTLDQIGEELDVLALGADAVFTSGVFASGQREFREINYRRVGSMTGDAIQLELDTAWLLPFPVEEVAKAVWIQLSRTTPKDKVYSIKEVHRDSELIVTNIVAGPKEDDGISAVIHTQIAMRCLPSAVDGSILLVMSSHARFLQHGHTWVGSSEGEAYVRVTSVAGRDGAKSVPLARTEFCRRSRAQPPVEANLTPAERAKWISVAMSGPMRNSSQRVDNVVQALENLLLSPSGKET